ncbi:MAG: hypothetical protein ABI166_02115 [Mucilaginibacter sp.]
MKKATIYSLKVWLTTVVLGMRIAGLIKILLDTDHVTYSFQDIFYSAIYDIPVGLIACLPSWLIFTFITFYLNNKKNIKIVYKKCWLTISAMFLGVLPFAIVFWPQLTHINYSPDMLPVLIAYTGVTIAGIWFYKLDPVNNVGRDLQSPT